MREVLGEEYRKKGFFSIGGNRKGKGEKERKERKKERRKGRKKRKKKEKGRKKRKKRKKKEEKKKGRKKSYSRRSRISNDCLKFWAKYLCFYHGDPRRRRWRKRRQMKALASRPLLPFRAY